ncbi:MAG TPA: YbhB/YbcL family Raf kinase inhibitor-like protein [Kofleriaceae bacterium]|nr:YbhB/YbcL family Raf kinase inhibitor-like protein [Kofleriaceae bacterium]
MASLPAIAYADTKSPEKLTVSSSAFDDNQPIPAEFTCDGTGNAPPISWSSVPDGTKSIAVMVEDPDAPKGTFLHWLVTDIPPTTMSLTGSTTLPDGAVAAKNDKSTMGFAAPCPTNAAMHHYHFMVYALDKTITRPTSRTAFMTAIKGHVLAQGELIGTYKRTKS